MKVSIGFRWFDLWIGMYIDRHNNAIYVCPLPTIVIKFQRNTPKVKHYADTNYTLATLCRDCQHPDYYHATSDECTLCNCNRFVEPDNLASTVQH